MLSQPAMLLAGLLLMVATTTAAQRRGQEAGGRRRAHRVQHGQCSYTFVLPEPEPCPLEPETFGGPNSLQRDSPAAALHLGDWPTQRVRQLEKVLENNTQWLQKLERYVQMNLRSELAQAQQHMVQNQTATMLELGTSLLNQTTAQTRKLTNVEAQVLNQTSRMEIQLLETSLSTNKLEKQLLLQGHELHRLQGQNSALETRVQALETQQQAELASLRGEKERLRRLLGRQSGALAGLERSLRAASSNSSLLQRQQRQLLESVQRLVSAVAQGPASMRAAEQVFHDCAEIQRFGTNASGVYSIHVGNMTEPRKAHLLLCGGPSAESHLSQPRPGSGASKSFQLPPQLHSLQVFCDMEANGGGWTLIQRRENGSVNFQRNWKDYRQGFGDPAGEHWLGNEVVHQLTSRAAYSLRVELQDWEGHEAHAQYEHFQLGSEGQLYSQVLGV
ncbi:angiopoietin-4 isoform X3 [Nycticebus coucang]|uniref:angiopoietin-4 isoform X3 n=1 Tax=Nycticebus coucang TaxID=9470 RepID=UPI00234DBC09|nr:angiopoietin-4 isoform X3 [Nycticebus coucang]